MSKPRANRDGRLNALPWMVHGKVSVDRKPRWPIFDHHKTASRVSSTSGSLGTPIACPNSSRSLRNSAE
jgi:hypothetical protein